MHRSSRLHEAVPEVRVLVQDVRRAGEIEVVDVVAWREFGGRREGGLEDDLGRGTAEVHDGGRGGGVGVVGSDEAEELERGRGVSW